MSIGHLYPSSLASAKAALGTLLTKFYKSKEDKILILCKTSFKDFNINKKCKQRKRKSKEGRGRERDDENNKIIKQERRRRAAVVLSEKAAYDSQLISSLHKKLLNNYVPISKEIDEHHTEPD